MATSSVRKKALLLGLLVAVLLATASCATSRASVETTVTISNPARVVVNVLVGDKNVKVATDEMTVKLDHPEQDIQIQTAEGRAMELHVQDGDVLVLYPDPEDLATLRSMFSALLPKPQRPARALALEMGLVSSSSTSTSALPCLRRCLE